MTARTSKVRDSRGRRSRRPARPGGNYRPRLETLEERTLPSFFVDAPNTGIIANPDSQNNSTSWVDVNGDGRPDLWIGAEIMSPSEVSSPPNLYINQGNGSFTDAFATAFPPNNPLDQTNDAHGSAWADVFNTGQPDLLQTTGALGGRHIAGSYFYVNRGGQLADEGHIDGLTSGLGGGRSPLFLDWNHDGLLDALFLNHSRAVSQGTSVLYEQAPTGFVNATAQAGIPTDINSALWAESVDLNGDGIPDLVIDTDNGPLLLEANQGAPGYKALPTKLPQDANITDMAVGDFFNNGSNDIFFTRRNTNVSDVTESGNNLIAATLTPGNQTGFTFTSTGSITFDFNQPSSNGNGGQSNLIFIGSQGYHPAGIPFTLDPTNPANQGIMPHDPNNGQGMYIGYDSSTQTWQIYYANQAFGMNAFVLNVSAPATNLTPIGFDPNAQAMTPYFLVYDPTTKSFVDETAQAGLNIPMSAVNVVAGDFNNDGFLDLYVSSEHQLSDQGGTLFLNNGDGTFRSVAGAAPFGGIFVAQNQRGRSVSMADFNGDGALDLFLPHTEFETPTTVYHDAPNELLLNTPNGKNWIELNLQGVESNRDAIGAEVFLTAGGVTQRRDVTGGKHAGAQNSNTVHFGLGRNTVIDKIVIDWPSGLVQTLTNISVDQIMQVIEPGGHSLTQARPITVFSPNQTYSEFLTNGNPQDFYQFTAGTLSSVHLVLNAPNVHLQLLDQSGNLLVQSHGRDGRQSLDANIGAGTYFVRVYTGPNNPGVAYSLDFDVISTVPLISGLTVNPLVAAAAPITVTATASTFTTGGAIIGGAEFFIDAVGADGTGVALAAADGSFDQSTEVVTGTIDATLYDSLTVGNHTLYVHARDVNGNWGPYMFMVFKKDNLGPITTQLTVTPDSSSTPPLISAEVSDKNTGLDKVLAAEYFIDTPGRPGTGRALTRGKKLQGGLMRFFSGTIPTNVFNLLSVGQHTIYVEGEDDVGNWGPLVSVTFTKTAPAANFDNVAVHANGTQVPLPGARTGVVRGFDRIGVKPEDTVVSPARPLAQKPETPHRLGASAARSAYPNKGPAIVLGVPFGPADDSDE